jgi:hypothetical protein
MVVVQSYIVVLKKSMLKIVTGRRSLFGGVVLTTTFARSFQNHFPQIQNLFSK